MSAKNFVNQFKNTRRLTGLLGRRPLGGQARLQYQNVRSHVGLGAKKPHLRRLPRKKTLSTKL